MEKWMKQYIIPQDKWKTSGLLPRERHLIRLLNAFPDYFLFSFVRNPYDRFVSIYSHSVRGGVEKGNRYYQRPLCPDLTIHQYAEMIRAGHWNQLSKFDRYHARPQVSYLPDFNSEYLWDVRLNNPLRCAFIGRFERIQEDWNVLRETLGFPDYPLFHTLLHSDKIRANSGVKRHYSEYYDEHLKQLVEEIYADDLKQFGYSFEEQGASVPANVRVPQVQDCLRQSQSVCADLKPPRGADKVITAYWRYSYLLFYRFPILARKRRKLRKIKRTLRKQIRSARRFF